MARLDVTGVVAQAFEMNGCLPEPYELQRMAQITTSMAWFALHIGLNDLIGYWDRYTAQI